MMQLTNIQSSIQQEHRGPGRPLPSGYQPSPHTVIVGRGRAPKINMGNKRLQVLAKSFLKKYEEGDKKCKTQIVSDIICMIRDACKGGKGAFVKHNVKTGLWYELDNSVAREKIGYVFRNLLADQYKSSAKSKVARRHQPITHFPTPCGSERQEQVSSSQQPNTEQLSRKQQVSYNEECPMGSLSYEEHDSFQARCVDVADILIQSSAFLDDNQTGGANDLFRNPLGSWITEDEGGFDYESLLRLPLL